MYTPFIQESRELNVLLNVMYSKKDVNVNQIPDGKNKTSVMDFILRWPNLK